MCFISRTARFYNLLRYDQKLVLEILEFAAAAVVLSAYPYLILRRNYTRISIIPVTEKNISVFLNEMVCEVMAYIHLAEEGVSGGCCEYDNESSGSVRGGAELVFV
jgi:hypothetical protein